MNYYEELERVDQKIIALKKGPIKKEGFYTEAYFQIRKLENIRRVLIQYILREKIAEKRSEEIHQHYQKRK